MSSKPDLKAFNRAARLGLAVIFSAALLASAGPTARADEAIAVPYKLHRFDDDFTYLRNPAKSDDVWDPIKYIPVTGLPNSYLTLGGELRGRFDHFDEPFFGLRKHSTLDDQLYRLLLSADLHVTQYFRTFVQIGSHYQDGKGDLVSPNDQDHLDLQQAFVEFRAPGGANDSAVLRAGRQELSFGSQRLVSVGEPPNVRRSFDSVRAFYKSDDFRIDAFVGRPVALLPDVFDDSSDPTQLFWGVYGVAPVRFIKGMNIDLYYFGLDRRNATFSGATALEERHTVGTRIWGKAGSFDYNAEFTGQFGTFGAKDIRAYAVYFDGGYTFESVPLAPRAGLKVNLISGDRNAKDNEVNTFNPLFPQYGYFGDSNLVVPSNLIDVYPSVTIKPTPNVTLSVGMDFLWRESTADAFYRVPLVPLITAAQSGSSYVGKQAIVEAGWQATRHVSVFAAYAHFFAGDVITDAKGRSVDYVSTRIAYKF